MHVMYYYKYHIYDVHKKSAMGLYYHYIVKQPYKTVCLLYDGKNWARGTAICSYGDNPCKKTGRTLAYLRAADALIEKYCPSMRTCLTAFSQRHKDITGNGWFSKWEFNPDLTDMERRFVERCKEEK